LLDTDIIVGEQPLLKNVDCQAITLTATLSGCSFHPADMYFTCQALG
jgi:hypothetical protein